MRGFQNNRMAEYMKYLVSKIIANNKRLFLSKNSRKKVQKLKISTYALSSAYHNLVTLSFELNYLLNLKL
jgi:hypothetical protein